MKPAHIRDYDLLVVGESFVEFRCDGDVAAADTYEKDIGGADLVVRGHRGAPGVRRFPDFGGCRGPFHAMIRERLISHCVNIDHVITCQGYNGIYFTSPHLIEAREIPVSPSRQRCAAYHSRAHLR